MIVPIIFLLLASMILIIGLIMYQKITKWVAQYVEKVPDVSIFVLCVVYGFIFILLLTSILWGWSGMSSVGMLFLLLVAPLPMIIVAIDSFIRRKQSIVHRYMFYLSLAYFVGLVLVFMINTL